MLTFKDAQGRNTTVSAATPLPITGGGGGGGGGGDASAANQTTQIAAEQLIAARVGDTASPAAGTLLARLAALLTALGSPLQAGGTVNVATPILPAGTDRSGSITTAATAQTVANANASRTALTFQNTSDTVMRLTESGNAATATTGFLVGAGQGVNVSTNKLVSVYCAAANKTFSATET